MMNNDRNWSFTAKCGVCDRVAAKLELIYDHPTLSGPDQVLSIEQSPGGSNGDGWKTPLERAERIKAAFTPPHTLERSRVAGFADDAGFCGPCSQFYCWSHWNVLSSGVGWCPEQHIKTIDPYCAYEA